ncbi:hypothetical protein [Lutibaculum baratangense]|uniref:Uncharacterized protein n=1 Tax=Lutibaculum baratangense AMV1 TaxID=631454 RepID=V4TKH7_9HYPH|nr:hypothetical protein [Lutibaculum baratangense]ESR26363.1 hypothetical protein N177_0863 [Lutibaculum baratangense AMV1]
MKPSSLRTAPFRHRDGDRPLGRILPGPLDDHALLPWRFHPAMRAADGTLRGV